MEKIKASTEKIKILILNLLSSFVFSSAVIQVTSNESFLTLEYAESINAALLFMLFGGLSLILYLADSVFELRGKPALFCACAGVFIFTVSVGREFYFLLVLCIFMIFFIYYMQKEKLISPDISLSQRAATGIIFSAFIMIAGFTAYACVLRYLSYRSSNFDMGIFAQMYEYMAKTGKAVTTSERNRLMSHFGVHFSPILYALLPLYMIFRTPAFLAFIQPFIALSGVFPFMLLMRKRKISEGDIVFYSLVFLLFPAFVAPCYYDFHENIFFTPLLLWLLYFIEKNNRYALTVLLILTLCVKEEAGLYVASIGLYVIFGMKRPRMGICLSAVAVLHFMGTTALISLIGGETLGATHYGNLIPPGESGITAVIKAVILSPGYTLSQLLSAEKIEYLLYILLPTMFLPLRTKRLSLYFLFMPMLLMNLITSYCYQFDIGYQYSFASGALIMYMCCVNIESEKPKSGKSKGLICLIVCAILCTGITVNKASVNVSAYYMNNETVKQNNAVIESIPDGVSVSASSFLIPKLYRVNELYMLEKDGNIFTDYVLIDKRYEEEYAADEISCRQKGYILVLESGDIRVYRKPAEK